MTKNAARQSGFTLLEILIATGILAIGLVTVFSLFPIGIYAVKDAVESTRSASLAESARSELTAIRADLRILDDGAEHYGTAPVGYAPNGYVPFGPWRYPGSVDTFRIPLYEYYDSGGALNKRIVFDERRMVPATLTGHFDGTSTVKFPPALQLALNRDVDRLEYYYAHPAAAGPNKYAPYEIFARVRGRKYQILDRAYPPGAVDADGRPLSGADLTGLVLADIPVDTNGTALAGNFAFDILLPVTLREPPVDVPQEWAGGVAIFTGGGPTYNVVQLSDFLTRNLIRYLAVPAGTNAWISLPGSKGDWFEVSGIARDAVTRIPQTITVANPQPASSPLEEEFKICLPLAKYTALTNTFDIAIDSQDVSLLGGGGPETSSLDTGADIEILLDGAVAQFRSSSPPTYRTTVSITGTLNAATQGLVVPGNFIRVDGRDYEIADATGWPGSLSFDVFGSVPVRGTDESDNRYFNIVLGYLPGQAPPQAPQVARFPVKTVTRPGVPPYGLRVTSFTIGPDANGNYPSGLGFIDGTVNPVHVLPRNHSQFSYEAVLSQKALIGDFSTADSNVYAPSWLADSSGPALGPIPYPPSLDGQTAALNPSIYHMLVLFPPNLPVTPGDFRSLDIGSVDPGYLSVNVGGNAPFTASHLPFHAYDRNDFASDLLAGVGTFRVATSKVEFAPSGTITADAVFLAEQVKIQLRDAGGMVLDSATILFVADDLSSITILLDNPGSIVADTGVNVFILSTGGIPNAPIGRGYFEQGADVVRAWYPSPLPGPPTGPASPAGWNGLPFTSQPALAHEIHLTVGDYIQGPTDFQWYAVKAIRPATASYQYDYIILDRPYEGADSVAGAGYFRYVTPLTEVYKAQVAVFRNYRVQSLRSVNGRAAAAAFGFDSAGNVDPQRLGVHLAAPLPAGVKPGDYIRADGDADHPVKVGGDIPSDPGLNDGLDGDLRWYMIDAVSADRLTITLTSPYGGYVPASEADAWQPASATSAIVRTFDTLIGAF